MPSSFYQDRLGTNIGKAALKKRGSAPYGPELREQGVVCETTQGPVPLQQYVLQIPSPHAAPLFSID